MNEEEAEVEQEVNPGNDTTCHRIVSRQGIVVGAQVKVETTTETRRRMTVLVSLQFDEQEKDAVQVQEDIEMIEA
jgi:hypothetical protein